MGFATPILIERHIIVYNQASTEGSHNKENLSQDSYSFSLASGTYLRILDWIAIKSCVIESHINANHLIEVDYNTSQHLILIIDTIRFSSCCLIPECS